MTRDSSERQLYPIKLLQYGLSGKNGLVRKCCTVALRAPRFLGRLSACKGTLQAFPVMANSVPKSGTHLLRQVISAFTESRDYGTFLSSMTSSFVFKERSAKNTVRFINSIPPGELLRAHLFFDPSYAAALKSRSVVHYLIYRDPRDVVVSEANYLRDMNRWHRLHRFFRKTSSLQEAVLLSIEGSSSMGKRIDFPNIASRYRRYMGWIGHPDVCAVRFEDLRSDALETTLTEILKFYENQTQIDIRHDAMLPKIIDSIQPKRSHTFRSGKAGGWAESFDDRCRAAFKRVAGNLLIELGYEADIDW